MNLQRFTKNLKCYFAIMTIFTFTSCQEEVFVDNSQTEIDLTSLPEFIDGRLVFESDIMVESFIDEYKDDIEKKEEVLNDLEALGFKSLLPVLDEDSDPQLLEEYYEFRKNDYDKIYNNHFGANLNTLNNSGSDFELDIEEDILIADPNFASLLNQKREIQVGDVIYWYNQKGVFHTNKDNYANLNTAYVALPDCPQDYAAADYSVINNNFGNRCNDEITPCCPGTYPIPNPDPTPPVPPTFDVQAGINQVTSQANFNINVINNLPICDYQPNFLNNLFGTIEKCITKYDGGKRRVKNKFWNQNYIVYSSVGQKVKNQKKGFLGIWYAKQAEHIEMGHKYLQFEYDIPIAPDGVNTFEQVNSDQVQYQYNGYVWNANGNFYNNDPFTVYDPYQLFPPNFPLGDDKSVLKVIIPERFVDWFNLPSDDYEIVGDDINDALQDLAQDGILSFIQSFQPDTESKMNLINDNDIQVVAPVEGLNRVTFSSTNWELAEKNDNKVSKEFQFNTGIFEVNLSDRESAGDYQFNVILAESAFSYGNVIADAYGMVLWNDTWIGNRLILIDED